MQAFLFYCLTPFKGKVPRDFFTVVLRLHCYCNMYTFAIPIPTPHASLYFYCLTPFKGKVPRDFFTVVFRLPSYCNMYTFAVPHPIPRASLSVLLPHPLKGKSREISVDFRGSRLRIFYGCSPTAICASSQSPFPSPMQAFLFYCLTPFKGKVPRDFCRVDSGSFMDFLLLQYVHLRNPPSHPPCKPFCFTASRPLKGKSCEISFQ
jgi:hypothetical protein